MAGTVIYEAHPAMFQAHPFWFILCVLLIAAFGIGIIILLYWYINTRATALTVTDSELMYERGILSKDRTSVSLKNVRSVSIARVHQSHPAGREHPDLHRWRRARSRRNCAAINGLGSRRDSSRQGLALALPGWLRGLA